MKCAQFFLVLINILDLIVGLTLIGLGILGHCVLKHFESSIGPINTISIILIVLGSFIVLVSFLGCCGAARQSSCLLILFCVFIGLILLVQIAVICLVFLAKNQVNVAVGEVLSREVNDYSVSDPSGLPNQIWDWIQRQFECCGANSYTDWKLNSDLNKTNSIPDSCCIDPFSNCGEHMLQMLPQPDKIHTQGCVEGLEEYMKHNLVVFGAVVIVAAIVLLIKFSLAVSILHSKRRNSAKVSMARKNIDLYASTDHIGRNEKPGSFTYTRFS